MGGLESLVDALWRCPIPSAPSPPHIGREGFGLTLLALALRLEHVGRISETLSLVDSTHMARSVTVDVDRGALTEEQRAAVRVGDGGALCVPIARLPRRDLAAVVVRDAAGRVLPRSTRVELPLSLAEGLHRAFEMLLDADPRVDQHGSALHRIRTGMNRSRWLIRTAITSMVESGPVEPGRLSATPGRDRPVPGAGTSDRVTHSAQIRQAAEDAVRALFDDGSPFPALLEIASTEHIVLAEVADLRSEVYLTYEAPLIPAVGARGAGQQARRIARGAIDEFTVEYRTIIPRAVDSYHVTIEVPPEISIRRFFLASDVDGPALDALRADMDAVADASGELSAISPKLLELELQSIASRLAEFGRRRAADLAAVESRMPIPARAAAARDGQARAAGSAGELLVGATRPVDALATFAQRYEADGFRKLAGGSLTPDALHTLADELLAAQVDRDVVLDNDPRDHAGHAHWRRRPFGTGDPSSEPVTVTVHATLADEPPSLSTNVWRFLLGILALVLGAGVLLFPSWRPFGWGTGAGSIVDAAGSGALDSADALVTVLLLVPGLLLARLDIPRRSSVLGTLRRVPQLVAYTAVFVTAALALVVATAEATALGTALLIAVLVLVALIAGAAGNEVIKARRRRVPVPRLETTPRWLVAEYARRPGAVPARPTVTFSTVELSTRDTAPRDPAAGRAAAASSEREETAS